MLTALLALHGNISSFSRTVVWSDEPWWVIQLCEFRPAKVYPKCSLEWPRYIPKSFSLLSSCLLIELFWTCGFVLRVGVNLVEESMQMIGGLQLVACTQSSQYVLNEINWLKDDASLVLFAWISMIMDLTLVSVDFSEQLNRNGWCQHNILGRENQKSRTSEPTTRILVLCKSRRRHWGWLL